MTRIRTLLVDDAVDLRLLLRTALDATGRYVVVGEADDGVTGIDRAEELRPDLVVLDLSMPRMDGLEALPRIRQVSPGSTIVVLSGHGAALAADAAFAAGAAAYLEKGMRPTAVVDALDRATGRGASATGTRAAHPPVEPPDTATLLSQLSHDVRTQITSAAGHIALVSRTLPPDHQAVEYAERAAAAVGRLHRLLEGAIAYTRVGVEALDVVSVPLAPLLNEVVADLTAVQADATARVGLTGPLDVAAHGDEIAFRRIFDNLIGNALRYSDGLVELVLEPGPDPDEVTVHVVDGGAGFAAEDLEELFVPFVRGRLGRERGGTGLGLAVAARLVQQLGGRISADNHERGGAQVTVTLPAG